MSGLELQRRPLCGNLKYCMSSVVGYDLSNISVPQITRANSMYSVKLKQTAFGSFQGREYYMYVKGSVMPSIQFKVINKSFIHAMLMMRGHLLRLSNTLVALSIINYLIWPNYRCVREWSIISHRTWPNYRWDRNGIQVNTFDNSCCNTYEYLNQC